MTSEFFACKAIYFLWGIQIDAMWNDEGRADVYYEVTKITTEKQTEIKTLRDVGYIEYTHNSKNITWGIKLTDKFLKDLNDVDR